MGQIGVPFFLVFLYTRQNHGAIVESRKSAPHSPGTLDIPPPIHFPPRPFLLARLTSVSCSYNALVHTVRRRRRFCFRINHRRARLLKGYRRTGRPDALSA